TGIARVLCAIRGGAETSEDTAADPKVTRAARWQRSARTNGIVEEAATRRADGYDTVSGTAEGVDAPRGTVGHRDSGAVGAVDQPVVAQVAEPVVARGDNTGSTHGQGGDADRH